MSDNSEWNEKSKPDKAVHILDIEKYTIRITVNQYHAIGCTWILSFMGIAIAANRADTFLEAEQNAMETIEAHKAGQ